MGEAVPIREVDERIAGRPSKADAARVLQNPIDRRVTAGDGCGHRPAHIGDQNRPRRRLGPCQWRPWRTARAGLTQKRDPFSVRRPGGLRIARGRGRDKANRLPRREQADEAVIVPVRHERKRPPVRRPDRRLARATRVKRLPRLGRAIECREPNLAIPHEGHHITAGRNDRLVAFSDESRRSTRHADRPYLNPRLNRASGGIGRRFSLAIRSVIAAANVHDGRAVARKRELRQLLPVVFAIRRDPARLEIWSVGHVDVADAALIERPRNRRPHGRCDQILRRGEPENLVHRERGWRRILLLTGTCRQRKRQEDQQEGSITSDLALGPPADSATRRITTSFNTCSITRRGPRSGSCSTRLSLLNSMVSRDVGGIGGPLRQLPAYWDFPCGRTPPTPHSLFPRARSASGIFEISGPAILMLLKTNGISIVCGDRMCPPPSGVSQSKR